MTSELHFAERLETAFAPAERALLIRRLRYEPTLWQARQKSAGFLPSAHPSPRPPPPPPPWGGAQDGGFFPPPPDPFPAGPPAGGGKGERPPQKPRRLRAL